jgi:Arf-GAP/coiled-coil/ANK repeat/PH domain-containing protein
MFQSGSPTSAHRNSSSEGGSGLLSRWLSGHYHGGMQDEKSVARHTVNLLTSTIKVDAEQSDLRFCFRIISPSKNYTLQVLFLKLIFNILLEFSFFNPMVLI